MENCNKPIIVSISGGKDSTAMLLKMLEDKIPIAEVIFCDTGAEHDGIYKTIDKIKNEYCPVTVLKTDFFDLLFNKYKQFPWAFCRWCTDKIKNKPFYKYLNEKYGRKNYVVYKGIAADEKDRLARAFNKNSKFRYYLAEKNITEQECLDYCYAKGFDFGGLYKIFSRTGCWICPLACKADIKKLIEYFPEKWNRIKEIEKQLGIKWKFNGKTGGSEYWERRIKNAL